MKIKSSNTECRIAAMYSKFYNYNRPKIYIIVQKYMKISLTLVNTYFRTSIHLFVAPAHPPIILLTTQSFKQKLKDISGFLKVVPPYPHPHLLARHYR